MGVCGWEGGCVFVFFFFFNPLVILLIDSCKMALSHLNVYIFHAHLLSIWCQINGNISVHTVYLRK